MIEHGLSHDLFCCCKAVEHELSLLRVIVGKPERLQAYQKEKGEWLEGQWELPTFVIETDDEKFKQYPVLTKKIDVSELPTVKTGITKYSIVNYVLKSFSTHIVSFVKVDKADYADYENNQIW